MSEPDSPVVSPQPWYLRPITHADLRPIIHADPSSTPTSEALPAETIPPSPLCVAEHAHALSVLPNADHTCLMCMTPAVTLALTRPPVRDHQYITTFGT
eukprot:CAMPEP_0119117536 /NCGR_PEP_ID=MMETSP1180-20130426/52895_1 /TAXON_ID=3052 ORGANISM="Chlamydomonas cf sp, Strain CCMP681" /NCGR_SAMPLE_ID=MMETSP1180 /ASSEMBLY_ACC=CAM_ASM_000741 /LENGTH=98 /DNA_ID=CAMNT_0007106807 /DNA_START=567 /DNA_END=863 /DNA_ORIENTATION=+